MIARFPGTCSCGCAKAFPAGAQVERSGNGWALLACSRPAQTPISSSGPCSMAEVRQVLAEARAVARRAAAAAASPSTLPPGLARGSRPEAVVGAGRVLPF